MLCCPARSPTARMASRDTAFWAHGRFGNSRCTVSEPDLGSANDLIHCLLVDCHGPPATIERSAACSCRSTSRYHHSVTTTSQVLGRRYRLTRRRSSLILTASVRRILVRSTSPTGDRHEARRLRIAHGISRGSVAARSWQARAADHGVSSSACCDSASTTRKSCSNYLDVVPPSAEALPTQALKRWLGTDAG